MLSAFICWSSRRISGFSTAVPNHHQRIMGFAASGGFWKFCLRFCADVCANKGVRQEPRSIAATTKRGEKVWFGRGEMRGERGIFSAPVDGSDEGDDHRRRLEEEVCCFIQMGRG